MNHVDALLAGATTEVLVMSTRPIPGPVRKADHENILRGVRYRVLLPDAARTTPLLAARLGALSRADVRTVPHVPTDALVIDGKTAILPTDTAVAAFNLPGVVTTTTELFERMWPTAIALAAQELPKAELDQRQRKLLSLLTSGSTDEAAAARLGVSVRTVRRMMADIMTLLGARSRFQAGAKAADRGWLLAEAG